MKTRTLLFSLLSLPLITVVVAGCQTTAQYSQPAPRPAMAKVSSILPTPNSSFSTPKPQSSHPQTAIKPLAQSPSVNKVVPAQKQQSTSNPSSTHYDTKPKDTEVENELQCMWQDYQNFKYEDALAHLSKILTLANASSEQRSRALIIAAASFYVLDDQASSKNCLAKAVKENPLVKPNRNILPTLICQMHDELLKAK